MENSAPSNVWTYYARWHRYLDSLIETNAFENTCLLYMSFCYIIFVTIWCKDNKQIFYSILLPLEDAAPSFIKYVYVFQDGLETI